MTTDRHGDQARDLEGTIHELQRTLKRSTYYYEFGFPLDNIPGPDQAITQVDLWDTVWPLLEGTRVLLSALSVALQTKNVDSQQGSAALNLCEGHLETAMHLLNRWRSTPAATSRPEETQP